LQARFWGELGGCKTAFRFSASMSYASPYQKQTKVFPIRTKYNSNLSLINFKTFPIVSKKQELFTLIKNSEIQD
jgi:hypothetical protein